MRWWSPEEIEAQEKDIVFVPREIARLILPLLRGEFPETPILIDDDVIDRARGTPLPSQRGDFRSSRHQPPHLVSDDHLVAEPSHVTDPEVGSELRVNRRPI